MKPVDQNPLVSVVICAYNAGRYLLPSIQSVLDQTYTNLEVLLIDDGSTDGSIENIQGITDSRIKIIRQANSGKSMALNLALDIMQGEFYAIHDADDLSLPRRVERQVKYMLEHPEIAAVFCGHETLLDERRLAPRFRPKGPAECRADIEGLRMPAHDPTGMFRVAAVRGLRYEPSLRIGQGYDYILQVGERYPIAVLGECLYSYRVHMTSNTKRDPERRLQMVREVWRRACQRRGTEMDQEFERHASQAVMAPDNNLAADFIESVVDLRTAKHLWEAVKTGLICARMRPGSFHHYKALAYALCPDKVRRNIRPSERRIRAEAAGTSVPTAATS
ncbi:MAG TPA: glycosyltransferase family 2 protein [Tepidisphaeraceae bacterium]|jgi:glycosyltransferase involved in cell wall biosynthesis|nr:glycosyltransferase family 2 protein [Tepidisphaeraceae bacterium]